MHFTCRSDNIHPYILLAFFSINLLTWSYISAYHKDFDYATIFDRETDSKLVCISPAGVISYIHTIGIYYRLYCFSVFQHKLADLIIYFSLSQKLWLCSKLWQRDRLSAYCVSPCRRNNIHSYTLKDTKTPSLSADLSRLKLKTLCLRKLKTVRFVLSFHKKSE